jgi:thymidylate kinase
MKNRLIVLGGFAGAGKTTIARRLGADFNYPFFSSDDFNAGLMPILNKSFQEISPIAYDLMWHILKKNLRAGVTCIMDVNMCFSRTWDQLDALKKEFIDTEVIPILLVCSLKTHKERIEKRGQEDKEHFNLGGGTFEDALPKYDFINNLKRDDIVRVDANGSIEEVYKEVIKVLHL